MSILYYTQPLATSEAKYLATYLGEVLMVLSKGVINMKQLEEILTEPTCQPRFRLFVLNPDETINEEIPQDDIIINTGNYAENYQQGQRRNVNITLINSEGKYTPNLNTIWVHNRFRLDIGVEYQDNVFWFPKGIYILGNPQATHSDSDKQVSLILVDKFALLEGKQGTLEATYEISAGTDIKQAIIGLLTLDNGTGYPIDLQPIFYDSVFEGQKTPYTLTKDAGSTIGEMILDLANMLNAECFYNSYGNLCFVNINETIDDSNKPVLWNYTDLKPEYFNSSALFDFENAVNEVQVVGDNINNEIFSASAKNTNPESPICIQHIGRRIKYINDSNIYSDKLAQDRANYELRKVGILNTTFTIEVSFNPLLLVNNLITVDDTFFNLNRSKFLIQSISYNIGTDSKMTLTVSNLTNFGYRELPSYINN
nr:MAG TPA: tail protein [Caudoviricetes sp.]